MDLKLNNRSATVVHDSLIEPSHETIEARVFRPRARNLTIWDLKMLVSRIALARGSQYEHLRTEVSPLLQKAIRSSNKKDILGDSGSELLSRVGQAYWGLRVIFACYLNAKDQSEFHKLRKDLDDLLFNLFMAFSVKKGEALIKDWTNYWVQLAIRDEETCRKPVDTLISGVLARKVALRIVRARQGDQKSVSFFYSLQMSKKCWLKLDDSKLELSLANHKQALGSQKSPLTEEAARWIVAAVDLVIPPNSVFQPSLVVPTRSACFENRRSDGGNRYLTTDMERIATLKDGRGGLKYCGSVPECLSDEQLEHCIAEYEKQYGVIDDPAAQTIELLTCSTSRRTTVKVCSVAEPGKFRILSVGPSPLYTAVRGLQGYMLNMWKKTEFSTMVDDLDDKVRKRFLGPALSLSSLCVSGDYKASTDDLRLEASMIAIDRVLKNLNLYGTKLGLLAMQTFVNIDLKYGDNEIVHMLNGQLMGGPLSFPILCMINLSAVLRADAGCQTSIVQSGLINGDDVAFLTDHVGYWSWKKYVSELGWTLSPGKSYCTKLIDESKLCANGQTSVRFHMQINSRLYHFRAQFERRWRYFRLISKEMNLVPYAHPALAIGHRVKSEPVLTQKTAGKVGETLLSGHGKRVRAILFDLFWNENPLFRRYRRKICGEIFKPHPFVPSWLGGWGLPPLNLHSDGRPFLGNVTRAQRKVAMWCAKNPFERFVRESLSRLPLGAQVALRDVKRVLPPIIARHELKFVGPLLYAQSEQKVKDLFGAFSAVNQWKMEKENVEEFVPVLQLALSEEEWREVEKSKTLSVKKLFQLRLDTCLSLDPQSPYLYTNIDNSSSVVIEEDMVEDLRINIARRRIAQVERLLQSLGQVPTPVREGVDLQGLLEHYERLVDSVGDYIGDPWQG